MMTELTTPDSLFRLIKHILAHNEAHPEERYDRRIVVFESELDIGSTFWLDIPVTLIPEKTKTA